LRCLDRYGEKNSLKQEVTMRAALTAGVALLGLLLGGSALAAGGGGGGSPDPAPSVPSKPLDPNFIKAKAMIQTQDYRGAVPLLQQVVSSDPKNAEAYTLMGYATRKGGDANGSLQYYNTALNIDPKNLGAHEYIGEAYLQLDRLPEAEQHLGRLDSICVFGCTEYRQLKAAVANYKAGRKPTN
jgi:tetratricopeptide (TPR) repeat protein